MIGKRAGYPVPDWLTARQPRRQQGGPETGRWLFAAPPPPQFIPFIMAWSGRPTAAKDFKNMVNNKLTMMGNS